MNVEIRIAIPDDSKYISLICEQIKDSARIRGTGISKRDPEYIKTKIINGDAVLAFYDKQIAGFGYIEVFQKKQFVANSGLIVFPPFRQKGLAKSIKSEIFKLSRKKFPKAKIFSITTNSSVFKINTELGFVPVSFNQLTQDENFWKGCKSCTNYDILMRNQKRMCLCTGLLYDPKNKEEKRENKVVLAYSGGLDTSYCLKFLIEEGYEVHTAMVNTGGFSFEELKNIENRALKIGAKYHQNIEATKEYYCRCIKYLIFGNVLKNNTYPLSVSSERFFQAIKIAEYANSIKAKAIAHGSTGAGNDQIRFDLAFQILCSDKLILSPIREKKLSRKEEIKYLQKKGLEITWEKSKYSINKGIWGTSIGGAETLNSDKNIPEEAYPTPLRKTNTEKIELEFEKGEFVSLNKRKGNPEENILRLGEISSSFAIGREFHVGDTLLGIKGKVAFEAPAALIIIKAHQFLEKHVLTKWQIYWKDQLANTYGTLLHEAQYLDPVMRNIEAFLENSQKRVSGKVTVLLHPYRFELVGICSEFDMMQSKVAQYGEMNHFWSEKDVKGFTKIFGNQMKIYHSIK